MAILGFVDGMEGGYIIGWAASTSDGAVCTISITDEAGTQLGRGRATRTRPDLAVLGLGRTNFGFRVAIPWEARPRHLHVLANGEEISDPPLNAGAGIYDINCQVNAGRLTGWVTERLAKFAPPRITAVNQYGVTVAEGASVIDPAEIDPFFTPARFALDFADACFGAGEQQLVILANGTAIARMNVHLTLQGNLDTITPTGCAGWLLSPEAPARAFTIEIWRDGEKAGTTTCNQNRDDVRVPYPDCGDAGFSFTFPEPAQPPLHIAQVSLRLPGAALPLFNSPYAVGSRAAAIAAAQRAAHQAYHDPALGQAARSVLQQALSDFIAGARRQEQFLAPSQPGLPAPDRLVVLIPVYRGVEVTRACIDSVLAHRDAATHHLLLINDGSPDADMPALLASYQNLPHVFVLTNGDNLGFVQTVNRGLNFANGADVLLLNADTIIHAGGLQELRRLAYSEPEIGTVTAMSNNATIFSYPSIDLRQDELEDIGWDELAAAALRENAGLAVDVPTGHGFCLLIKAEVLRRVGRLDVAFGRGYGEENDFCTRAATLGYRNVAAAGVLVEHRESISFEDERPSLIAKNMPRLNALYPEYVPIVTAFERQDGLRRARWALDRLRLARAVAAGQAFSVVISNGLDGGTKQAIKDMERVAAAGDITPINLRALDEGLLEVSCERPRIAASFMADEADELFRLLDQAVPAQLHIHQLLGFPQSVIKQLAPWAKARHSVYLAHDFYALCPRVTMIDAIGRFCDVADAATCARCVEMAGAHETSRLTELTPAEHRSLFTELLGHMAHVIAPSANAASYLMRGLPGITVQAVPHPERHETVAAGPREGTDDEIILLGAIGPHKGSAKLLELARRARLTHPHLSFRVIGYTNVDKELTKIGNVTITGKYTAETLPKLLAETRGRLAIFLSTWPETYSYTLSEAAAYGFIPLVPDIGAPAARVRAAQFGVVFPFPIDPEAVLTLLDSIAAGQVPTHAPGATPAAFLPTEADFARAASLLAPPREESKVKKVRKK